MITSVEFTVKGDYDEITFRRNDGSSGCELNFHRRSEMAIARFKFDDMRKAVNILNGGARWITSCKEYADAGFNSMEWRPDSCFCSRCGHGFSVIDNCTEEFDFCPKCGAEMDGE